MSEIEQRVFRLRRKISRLFVPFLVLAGLSFSLGYFANLITESNSDLVLSAAAVILLFWLVPLMSHLFGYLELTNQRLIYRFGLFGARKRVVLLAEISSIEVNRLKRLSGSEISIYMVDDSEFVITGYARGRLIASEIERLARAA